MEHIITRTPGEIDCLRYRAYVDSIRDQLPAHVYAFASNMGHFDLTSHSSLHDAWLESLTVREAATGERNEIRRLEIHLCLLGPFHDRRIHLRYTGVARYRFDTPAKYGESRYEHTAHGDLFTHDVPTGLHPVSREAMSQWGQVMPGSFTRPKLTLSSLVSMVRNVRRSPDLSFSKLRTLARIFG